MTAAPTHSSSQRATASGVRAMRHTGAVHFLHTACRYRQGTEPLSMPLPRACRRARKLPSRHIDCAEPSPDCLIHPWMDECIPLAASFLPEPRPQTGTALPVAIPYRIRRTA